jgi:U3 small nucleolar RNA-associated protein 3
VFALNGGDESDSDDELPNGAPDLGEDEDEAAPEPVKKSKSDKSKKSKKQKAAEESSDEDESWGTKKSAYYVADGDDVDE